MAKILVRLTAGGNHAIFKCPGCEDYHVVRVQIGKQSETDKQLWGWNGNVDKPTIIPSIRTSRSDDKGKTTYTTCHNTVTYGKILFHGDSPHKLANQTVDLPELSEQDL